MSLEKKLDDFSSLIKVYKKKPLVPAVFKIINGNQIEFADPTSSEKLIIDNSSFTEKKNGFATIKQKWIIKNTTEHGTILMCIELTRDKQSIVYYYSFENENAQQTFDELNEFVGYKFEDLRIYIKKETQIDRSTLSVEEKNLFNELEKQQNEVEPRETKGGKRKTKKRNNKKKKTKKRKRTRMIRP